MSEISLSIFQKVRIKRLESGDFFYAKPDLFGDQVDGHMIPAVEMQVYLAFERRRYWIYTALVCIFLLLAVFVIYWHQIQSMSMQDIFVNHGWIAFVMLAVVALALFTSLWGVIDYQRLITDKELVKRPEFAHALPSSHTGYKLYLNIVKAVIYLTIAVTFGCGIAFIAGPITPPIWTAVLILPVVLFLRLVHPLILTTWGQNND